MTNKAQVAFFQNSKPVLVFNGSHRLIAITRSVRGAAELSGINPQSISFACNGKYISSGTFFFRHLDPNIEVEIEDLGKLKIRDYDKLCDIQRKYHSQREIARRRNIQKLKK